MTPLVLSVIVPVYNEAPVIRELAERCVAAANSLSTHCEVILVDDASTDATGRMAAEVHAPARILSLPNNLGQFGATQAGLAAASGEIVVVIDGDLQDPPEHLVSLVQRLQNSDVDVVFATKRTRHDPVWFRLGRMGYVTLLRLAGTRTVPTGIGSYCAMRQPLAAHIAALDLVSANLAPVLIALGSTHSTIPYDKHPRYDGTSRVGAAGLVREAVGSLVVLGALRRLAVFTSGGALVVGVVAMLNGLLYWASGAIIIAMAAAITAHRNPGLQHRISG